MEITHSVLHECQCLYKKIPVFENWAVKEAFTITTYCMYQAVSEL